MNSFDNLANVIKSPIKLGRPLLLGDQSELIRIVWESAVDASFDQASTRVKQLHDSDEMLQRIFRLDSGYPLGKAKFVLAGLYETLAGLGALNTWDGNTPLGPIETFVQSAASSFKIAIQAFDDAWGEASARGTIGEKAAFRQLCENPLWNLFSKIAKGKKLQTTAGFWIVWDLVSRLHGRAKPETASSNTSHIATTPVLFVEDHGNGTKEGHVLWLTVELFEGPSGFDPDPLSLGLTAVHSLDKKSSSPDFIDIMRQVWKMAKLPIGIRGQWRITSLHPNPDVAATRPCYLYRLAENSIEAAALAAIWAARGVVPYETEYRSDSENASSVLGKPFALIQNIAISASIVANEECVYSTNLKLVEVGETGKKIGAARAAGLDTVLFAENEETSNEERTNDEERKKLELQQTKASAFEKRTVDDTGATIRQQPSGVHIQRFPTIGRALDRLLVINQRTHFYQEERKKHWESQWEGDSGKLPAMLAKTGPKPKDNSGAETGA